MGWVGLGYENWTHGHDCNSIRNNGATAAATVQTRLIWVLNHPDFALGFSLET